MAYIALQLDSVETLDRFGTALHLSVHYKISAV